MASKAETGRARYCATCERYFVDEANCPIDGTLLVQLEAPDRFLGQVLDERYAVRERLGSGGMGVVYRATQLSTGRDVAIKILTRHLADETIIKRFLREAKLTSRLAHPNAVSVLDFGQDRDAVFYLVMDLLTGCTLDVVLQREGPFAPDRVARIAFQICQALAHAHSLGILHRDLKPSNVMLLDEPAGHDAVKVLDFGVAKSLATTTTDLVTSTGALVGTPAFMAPEVMKGQDPDQRSDLYSLGVLLYQLSTGRLPFIAPSMPALIHLLVTAEPIPVQSLGVPDPLAHVIMRLVAKDPPARHADAVEVIADLTGAPQAAPASDELGLVETITASAPTLMGAPEPAQRLRLPLAMATIAIALGALLLGLVVGRALLNRGTAASPASDASSATALSPPPAAPPPAAASPGPSDSPRPASPTDALGVAPPGAAASATAAAQPPAVEAAEPAPSSDPTGTAATGDAASDSSDPSMSRDVDGPSRRGATRGRRAADRDRRKPRPSADRDAADVDAIRDPFK